jgi:hypothetical protein
MDDSVNPATYTSAGVFFTNDTLFLGGYQTIDETTFISGIGGTKEDGETYMDTALREMIEEIFDTVDVPKDLIDTLKGRFPPHIVFQQYTYIIATYSFKDLEKMLKVISKFGLKSRLYDTIPTTLYELVLFRYPTKDSEITQFLLLPLNLPRQFTKSVHKELKEDIEAYKQILAKK